MTAPMCGSMTKYAKMRLNHPAFVLSVLKNEEIFETMALVLAKIKKELQNHKEFDGKHD